MWTKFPNDIAIVAVKSVSISILTANPRNSRGHPACVRRTDRYITPEPGSAGVVFDRRIIVTESETINDGEISTPYIFAAERTSTE